MRSMEVFPYLCPHEQIAENHPYQRHRHQHRISVDVVPHISVHDEAALAAQLEREIGALVPGEQVTIVIDHNYSE